MYSKYMETKKCVVCVNEFSRPVKWAHETFNKTVCCSRKCSAILRTGKKIIRLLPSWNKGKSSPWAGKNGFKKGQASWNKGKKYPQIQGTSHHNWRGGVSRGYIQGYYSAEYKWWRNEVFERDKYTCTWCGQVGGTLNADHIKPFAFYPELRYDTNNGRTLCISCHKKTDTYGRKSKLHLNKLT